ncbi:MCM-domain-containing protein [Rhizoclosmatium globosum]|uniref:DNA replication licensing factor MCM7 n=1 Tax=Rhizoclosmatium globosum TaxID=329046 RepID=A0A1Y2CLB7_9FUNG|nr:MCM-domain-containing protein [Rhizoclosmatium globosum]|eukprot:ORY47747.1 MCM-domain-containing protein [Rhizoclosmatium globosum]
MASTNGTSAYANYKTEKDKITAFFNKFSVVEKGNQGAPVLKYKDEMQSIAAREKEAFIVDLDDVASFDQSDEDLVRSIENNTPRYIQLFSEVVDEMLPSNNENPDPAMFSPLEEIIHQRKQRDLQRDGAAQAFPAILTRRYSLYFKPRAKQTPVSIREVKGLTIGRLVTVRGMVTRVSNVKPQALVLALSCDKCGYENFQEVTSSTSTTPITECTSEDCKKNKVKGRLYMQTRASKFIKFQEVKIQELTDQVPMGSIPRSMTVHLCEELTRTCSPGDTVHITGVFMPVPYVGFKALRAGLLTDTYLLAQHVTQLKKQYSQMHLDAEMSDRIRELTTTPDLYSRLAKSIAPEIYGHEDVKKALLLLLVGGHSKVTGDGMKIRGDLNVCLMGDPGVAKSQLLKYISKIAPRGVYTTGRGSSGVGLTASVVRDPVTEEMVLEGGALVLADNGIACIDEFDKMDENDRTAIHEVMEQQTISISKAGITTTLNARTSILAAANPQRGRYDVRLKATENINLPAALLSRFDLLFLILDKPDLDDDLRLAAHVTYVHKHNRHQVRESDAALVDLHVLRHYISLARMYNPVIKKDTAQYLVTAYTELRQRLDTANFQHTCARSLLSMIRLASALTRLRFSEEVEIGDVEEALRLIEVSKASITDTGDNNKEDPVSKIFNIIRDMSREGHEEGGFKSEIDLADIRSRITVKGFSDVDLEKCIKLYENSNLWMRTKNGTCIAFINGDDDD